MDWLKYQLRYPEDLFERQLEANYKYHVDNPTVWKSEGDFHERPKAGDLYYIESDLGDGVEYVGLDLVEYKGDTANILAGMYVVRHGDNFGDGGSDYPYNSSQTNWTGDGSDYGPCMNSSCSLETNPVAVCRWLNISDTTYTLTQNLAYA